MIPAWAIRLLPYGAAVLALIAAVVYIDHRGYQRAQDQQKLIRAQEELTRAQLKQHITDRVSAFEQDLSAMVVGTDKSLATHLGKLDLQNRTIIQPTITKEIENEVRYTYPDGLTVGVFNGLNKARASSRSTCAAGASGNVECSLPGDTLPD